MSIFVVGGNGFVGQHVCKRAVELGLNVTSLSRSGAPDSQKPWHSKVTWLRGDAREPHTFKDQLINVDLLVSCVGGIGSDNYMRHVNGEVNLGLLKSVLEIERSRPAVAFVSSAHAAGCPKWFLSGYFEGKQTVEDVLRSKIPTDHLILQPGFIYGLRYVNPFRSWSFPLPLNWLGRPLRALLSPLSPTFGLEKIPLLGVLMTPPTDVQDIAVVMVEAALQQRKLGRDSPARIARGVTLSSSEIANLADIIRNK